MDVEAGREHRQMNAAPSRTSPGTSGPNTAAPVIEVVTDPALAEVIAGVAAVTFPLACPPHCTGDDIAAFITNNFRPANFVRHMHNPESDLLIAREDDEVIGYSLIHHAPPANPDVTSVVTERPA